MDEILRLHTMNVEEMVSKYDLQGLRDTLRKRLDLQIYDEKDKRWYQTAFLEGFVFMYDTAFYDRHTQTYKIEEILEEGQREFGGYDVICLWQSYPRLGIDERNQFDYYREMPGGIEGVKDVISRAHAMGTKVLLNYNPWDVGTRREGRTDQEILAELIRETGADGVFLDTMSSASNEFVETIESAKSGLVFDPEAIPVPAYMPTITGSWQQFATVEPPELITNRWIEPRFSLRGVNRLTNDHIQHVKLCFFYGYGHVVWENIFGWWNPWQEQDRLLLKKCIHILREYQDCFLDPNWEHIFDTLADGVYANKWSGNERTIYTIYNKNDFAIDRPVLEVFTEDVEVYDIWTGLEFDGNVKLEPKSVGCLMVQKKGMSAPVVYSDLRHGQYTKEFEESLSDNVLHFQHYKPAPGKRLPVDLEALTPKPVPNVQRSQRQEVPKGMVLVEGGRFPMSVRHNNHGAMEGACYGDISKHYCKEHPVQYFWMEDYLMDETEVTNLEYLEFLKNTRYIPRDMTSFLRHWEGREASEPWKWTIPVGKDNHPVVWVDLEDARAYAKWMGKRLPTEEEWQYAAQGREGLLWPWGNEYDPDKCNSSNKDTCDVRKFDKNKSPWGCLDMAGNVWEWTESERDDGHTRYAIIRGGSYMDVKGSIWYTASGPQPNDAHEKLLLMYPGLDRCGTIGFRCVAEIGEV